MSYTILLLDADHTLFDYDRAEEFALFESFRHYKIEGDYSSYRDIYRPLNIKMWKMLERGEIDKSIIKVKRFEKLFQKLNITDVDPVQFSETYLSYLGKGVFLLDGAEELCEYLSEKYRLVILTNGIKEVQENRICQSEIYKYLELIVTSDEVGINKPEKGIYDWVFNKLGNPHKSEVLMVGDSLGSDITGGINYGIDTLWYNFRQETTELSPTYIVNSLMEIKNIL